MYLTECILQGLKLTLDLNDVSKTMMSIDSMPLQAS